jgi:hypothetical protein
VSRHNRERRAKLGTSVLALGAPRIILNEPKPVPIVKPSPAGVNPSSWVGNAGCQHTEPPSIILPTVVVKGENPDISARREAPVYDWEIPGHYYGTIQRCPHGFPINDSPYTIIGITAIDETARHDWREYQQIKNQLCGPEWEGAELYPSESRLRDPSNRFYLWCVPPGVFPWGIHLPRLVFNANESAVPQRGFPQSTCAAILATGELPKG